MLKGDFHFKGSRDYIQSASVFDFIVANLDTPPRDVNFVFNNRTGNQLLVSERRLPEEKHRLIGTWQDSERALYIHESDRPVTQREPYDEAPIVARCEIRSSTIHTAFPISGYSFIECCVAAYKHLLHQLFPERKTKYVFVRIALRELPSTDFEVRYTRKLASSFYQGDISSGGRLVGRIFYGEWH